jgi:phage tail-like protein
MATRQQDPFRNFRFKVEFDGVEQAAFSEVTTGETTTDVVDYREGNEPAHVRKLDGLTKYGNITLKRGVTDSQVIADWHRNIVAGQIQSNRKTITITVRDEAGADKARWVVTDAWPMKYQPSGLNGKGNEVFVELLELCNEGIERAKS